MMPDTSIYSALAAELNSELAGGKIDRVTQPSKEIVILTVRIRGESRNLLLSASPSFSRVHITETGYEKLPEPPMFCMLLRKHLTGAVIEKIEQLNCDKIICLSLNYSDEYGRAFREKLYSEMVPGKINIVLVDEEGIIIDCIYRREYEPDLYRRVFPGMIYHLPKQPENYVPSQSGDAAPFVSEEFPSLSAFLDSYYSEREKQDLYRRRTKELRMSLISARKRIEKKLNAQRLELKHTEDRDSVRRDADLITANIYRIRRGDSSLVCEDFYQEGCPEKEIILDIRKSPQDNAAALYKKYSKLKTAEEYLVDLIDKAEQQLDYIESAVDELERAGSNADIEGIRTELTESGIIRSRTGRNSRTGSGKPNANGKTKAKNSPEKGQKKQLAPAFKITTKNGLDILVGRNNLQNDELTFHTARKTDLWFHVKNYHGSHVILRTLGSIPLEEDVLHAARVAAENSQAATVSGSGIGNVEVDYTFVRYVHKPAGALPGKVIYTNQTTVIVPVS